MSIIVASAPIGLFTAAGTAGAANRILLARLAMPIAGTLDRLWMRVDTASSVNMRGLVYDIGEAASGFYSELWEGADVSMTPAGWKDLGNPNLSVVAGKNIMAGYIQSGSTAAVRGSTGAVGGFDLPATATDPGLTPRTFVRRDHSSFAGPATISEAEAAAQGGSGILVVARVT